MNKKYYLLTLSLSITTLFLLFNNLVIATTIPYRFNYLDTYKTIYPPLNLPKPISETVMRDGKEVAKATFTYNKNKQLDKVLYYKAGKFDGLTHFFYNSHGLLKEITYDKNKQITENILYELHPKKKIILSYIVIDVLLKQTILWSFEYNSQNKNIIGRRFIKDINNQKELSEYYHVKLSSSNKNKINEYYIYNVSGEKQKTIKLYYNADNILQKRVLQTLNTKQKEEIHYLYNNNLLQKVQYINPLSTKKPLLKEHIIKYK